MRCLITGGVGRLGVKVVKLFSAHNHTVRVLDLPSANWRSIEDIKGVEVVKGSILDPKLVSKVCSDIDAVIHLAAILPPKSEENEEITKQVNVEGTRILCEEEKKKGGLPLIFASSISVYGITVVEKPPLKERRQLKGHNIYSNSKIGAEDIINVSKLPQL